MAEVQRTVHRTTLRVIVWPVGPKLVFDQMAAPVPEIMVYFCICLIKENIMLIIKSSAYF
jgi:hypothetical protein